MEFGDFFAFVKTPILRFCAKAPIKCGNFAQICGFSLGKIHKGFGLQAKFSKKSGIICATRRRAFSPFCTKNKHLFHIFELFTPLLPQMRLKAAFGQAAAAVDEGLQAVATA